MNNWVISILVIVVFFVVMFYQSQQKFKNKMLCTFVRPNKQKIEQWVPLDSRYVVFDRGRYGIGRYTVNPHHIIMEWYNRGLNKFFPVLIPTLEFRWNSPNPVDQTTGEVTWLTPEAQHAGWEEHQHVAFAKGTQVATGKKSRFPDWFFPLVTLGLVVIVLLLVWKGMGDIGARMAMIEQQLSLIAP